MRLADNALSHMRLTDNALSHMRLTDNALSQMRLTSIIDIYAYFPNRLCTHVNQCITIGLWITFPFVTV